MPIRLSDPSPLRRCTNRWVVPSAFVATFVLLLVTFGVGIGSAQNSDSGSSSTTLPGTFTDVAATCHTPNPGGTGYLWAQAATYDPFDNYIYASIGGVVGGAGFPAFGYISVIAPPCTVIKNIPVARGGSPYELAYDPALHEVYASDSELHHLYLIRGTAIVATMTNPGCGGGPIAYDPATQDMLVGSCDNAVSVISGSTLIHVFTTGFNLGADPAAILAGPNNEIFVANWGSGDVAVLNASTYHWITHLRAGNNPDGLTWDSLKHEVIVSHFGNFLEAINPYTNSIASVISLPGSTDAWNVGYATATRHIFVVTLDGSVLEISPDDSHYTLYLGPDPEVGAAVYDPVTAFSYIFGYPDMVWVVA